jgi:predicted ATPase/DNA-binding CsgD family transcriptional regulator
MRHAPTSSPPSPPADSPPHNLPLAVTSFIGRQHELTETARLLGTTRLLTLTGSGGVGKTRLALEAARAALGDYPDGAWLVELAALTDPALVPLAVARALGMPEQPRRPLMATLAAWLGSKRLLLVLDNCEHLLDACAALAEALLRACPHLRVLVTSREALRVGGEVLWRVPSLAVPNPRCMPVVAELGRVAAVRLFVERARAARPDFALRADDVAAVVQICRRLDGLPLAIELAAARAPLLSVGQIAARLGDSLALLTGGGRAAPARQRALRATLDWSHALLTEPERILFRRLAVFAGGWTVEAAEAVGAGAGVERGAVLDLLARLVDQSLVQADPAGAEARCRLLEPVRQYARERLRAADDEERAARDRHRDWCLGLAEAAEPDLDGSAPRAWLDRLEAEHDNLRAALGWTVERAEAPAALRLGRALVPFWLQRGHLAEGRRWLAAIAEVSAPLGRTAERARLLHAAGLAAAEQGEYAEARRLYEEALAAARAAGDRGAAAHALLGLGHALGDQGEAAAARACFEAGLAALRALGDRPGVAGALDDLGVVLTDQGDYAAARPALEESLALGRELGLPGLGTGPLLTLGYLALQQGDLGEAHAQMAAALTACRELGKAQGMVNCVEGLAAVAAARGQLARAARLDGAAAAWRAASGAARRPADAPVQVRAQAAARGAVDEAAWAASWAAGRALPLEQAVAEALADGPEATTATPLAVVTPLDPAGLTPREVEVLRLVARGATDAQVAAALSISVKTVHKHVASVLGKTGSPNRTAAAAFAIRHGLA